MNDMDTPDGIDITALIFGEQETVICWVQMPASKMEPRFESVGIDDDGAYLVNTDGNSMRIGSIDPATYDEALGMSMFRIYLLDETGLPVDEYPLSMIRPEPANAYGA